MTADVPIRLSSKLSFPECNQLCTQDCRVSLALCSWDRRSIRTRALLIILRTVDSQTEPTPGPTQIILHTLLLQQEDKASFNFCLYMWTIYFILRWLKLRLLQKLVSSCRSFFPEILIHASQVHHIDPKGEDSGVVYSEMQGRENTSMDLMSLRWVISISKHNTFHLFFFFQHAASIEPTWKRLPKRDRWTDGGSTSVDGWSKWGAYSILLLLRDRVPDILIS